jgi:hypothetical protein
MKRGSGTRVSRNVRFSFQGPSGAPRRSCTLCGCGTAKVTSKWRGRELVRLARSLRQDSSVTPTLFFRCSERPGQRDLSSGRELRLSGGLSSFEKGPETLLRDPSFRQLFSSVDFFFLNIREVLTKRLSSPGANCAWPEGLPSFEGGGTLLRAWPRCRGLLSTASLFF